jgi:peroxiredoxin
MSEVTAKVDIDRLFATTREMIDDLRSRGAAPGIEVGERAPDFVLPDATGAKVALSDRLAAGPVVMSFYRGAWCPICNIELQALQGALPQITKLGASLLAISPQAPDDSMSLVERHGLEFDVLSDVDQQVIRAYRLQFELPDALRQMYPALGFDLPRLNADSTWRLPVPATFVIGSGGIVQARHVDPNY